MPKHTLHPEETLEERFWTNVWRCTHLHPCTHCCWPWLNSLGLYSAMDSAPMYSDPRLSPSHTMYVAQAAYLLTTGTLLFRSRYFHLCHQCDYKPCCNPSHIQPGSSSDNARDRARRPARTHASIRLPDGQALPYAFHEYRQGPCSNTRRNKVQTLQPIFCLYANTYDGARGYPLTQGLCQVVSPSFLGKDGDRMPEKDQRTFIRQLISAIVIKERP